MMPAWCVGLVLSLLVGPLMAQRAETELQAAHASATDTPLLDWHEVFKLPVGPRGLEPTDRLLHLKDQRVRIQGYMINEEEPVPGLFMLAPTPVAVAELADGPADYLPAVTVFVHLPDTTAQHILTYRPGLWSLDGVLRLGAHHEQNGRISYVRVMLDDLQAVRAPDEQPLTFLNADVARHDHHP
jgi:hypothetical protein